MARTKTLAMANGKKVVLEDYIMECIRKAVDEVAADSVSYLAAYIDKNWYSKYNPKRYKRTYDFLNSASKTETTISGREANAVVCMLFFDTEKIIPRYYGPGYLNPHVNMWGASTAEQLPGWIENGGWFYGRGKTDGLHSMEATIKMLEKQFPTKVATKLRKMGLQIKVVGA